MKRLQSAPIVAAALVIVALAGCHNTAQGVKADTRRALEKIDQKLDKDSDRSDRREKKER